jgi:hypothetical protein
LHLLQIPNGYQMTTLLHNLLEGAMPLNEVLNVSQRLKRKAIMRRNKAKLKLGRKRARMKLANTKKLNQRAGRQARSQMFNKIAKKNKSKMSYAARAAVERILARRKAVLKRNTRKLLPTVRKADRAKLSRK